jgi:AAA domain
MAKTDANSILCEHGADALRTIIEATPCETIDDEVKERAERDDQLKKLSRLIADGGDPTSPVDPDYQPASRALKLFPIKRWSEITFDLNEEYLIDAILPRQGVGLLYGASQTFKSFIAYHMSLCIALKRPWAERHVEKAPVVYIAAEGALGSESARRDTSRRGAIFPRMRTSPSSRPHQIWAQQPATSTALSPPLTALASSRD